MGQEKYVNHGSIIAIAIVFSVLTIASAAGRICSRRVKKAGLGIDDFLSLGSVAFLIGSSVDLLVGTTYHIPLLGYHSSGTSFDIPGIKFLDKVEFCYNLLWICGVSLVKLSFLFFYRRIFRGKLFDFVSWTTIALVFVWGVVFFCLILFGCGSHVERYFSTIPPFLQPTCLNTLSVLFANSLLSCLLDVIILLMPMPLIWQLQLRNNVKVFLTGMFAIGSFCVAASAIRLTLLVELWWAVRTENPNTSILGLGGEGNIGADDFGIVSLVIFWSHIELGVANVACCLPSLGPLIHTRAYKSLQSKFSNVSYGCIWQRFGSDKSASGSDVKANELDVDIDVVELLPSTREQALLMPNERHERQYDRSATPRYGRVQKYIVAGKDSEDSSSSRPEQAVF